LNPENIAIPLKKRKKKSQNGKYPVVKKSKILLVKFRILCPPAEGLDWRTSIFLKMKKQFRFSKALFPFQNFPYEKAIKRRSTGDIPKNYVVTNRKSVIFTFI